MVRMTTNRGDAHTDRPISTMNGFLVLLLGLALLIGGGIVVASGISRGSLSWLPVVTGILMIIVGALLLAGLYTLQPTRRPSCSSSAPIAGPAARRACAAPTRSTRAGRSRCAPAT